jgi:hypothetical protein
VEQILKILSYKKPIKRSRWAFYTFHGHILRLFTQWEAQFVTGALDIWHSEINEASSLRFIAAGRI